MRSTKVTISIVLTVIMTAGLFAAACGQSQTRVRQVDQHQSGQFSTVAEFGGFSTNFWKCHRSDEQITCERICDYEWYDGRICAPELHHEFGRVTKPTSRTPVVAEEEQ